MRKLELVYLHELLLLVRAECEQRVGHPIDCEEYDQLETHPLAITQPKARHSEAVRALAGDLTAPVPEHSSSDTDTAAEAPWYHHEP